MRNKNLGGESEMLKNCSFKKEEKQEAIAI